MQNQVRPMNPSSVTTEKPTSRPDAAMVAVRVWDLPTRVFHWLLAASVIAMVITGKVGGNALVWHMRIGLLIGALLLFRIVWGLIGGRWSRFASFIYAPATVLRYLRGEHRPGDHFDVGHNPLGSFSVFAMIGLLALQVATGLVADDEIATTGPLNRFVASATGLLATSWHKSYGQWILIALVVLHIGAILVYRRRGVDLIRPMLHGDKALPNHATGAAPAAQDSLRTRIQALLVIAVCMGLAAWVARQGG